MNVCQHVSMPLTVPECSHVRRCERLLLYIWAFLLHPPPIPMHPQPLQVKCEEGRVPQGGVSHPGPFHSALASLPVAESVSEPGVWARASLQQPLRPSVAFIPLGEGGRHT